jgi:hypothetical protein
LLLDYADFLLDLLFDSKMEAIYTPKHRDFCELHVVTNQKTVTFVGLLN